MKKYFNIAIAILISLTLWVGPSVLATDVTNKSDGLRIILLGKPTCGKGTYADKLSKQFNIEIFQPGVLVRDLMANKDKITDSSLAKLLTDEVVKKIKEGGTAPDELVVKLFKEFSDKNKKKGFILDAFPKTISQYECLSKLDPPIHIDYVIHLYITDDEAINRAGDRWVDSKGKSYSVKVNALEQIKNKEGATVYKNKDGEILSQREDEKYIEDRLKVYTEKSLPVVNRYEQLFRESSKPKFKYLKISTAGEINDVYNKILRSIEGKDPSLCRDL
jgi:adenylate kinase